MAKNRTQSIVLNPIEKNYIRTEYVTKYCGHTFIFGSNSNSITIRCDSKYAEMSVLMYWMRQKSNPLKLFCCFLSSRFEF